MTADDLPAAFDTLPAAWAKVLPGWTPALRAAVCARVREVSADRPIGPADPFRALRLVAPEAVKVVIFGQDPYPTAGHADGLAFSAGQGRPRSLGRIFEVLAQDRPGFNAPAVWKLDPWAKQGVLLLNPALTVEIGVTASHLKVGWQALTIQIVEALCERDVPPVFLLWGSKAQSFFAKAALGAVAPRVLIARHPSYDIKREFMKDGSHFVATQDVVDWWAFDQAAADSDIV
ncbi:MAG: uracil-DNA glycosylase [Burkholderiales bacterium]|nr:uracil-DNA glycosylase [Burkholderiales bacterium]